MSNAISVYRGDSKSLDLTFTDSDGAAIDITGWIIFFTVKPSSAGSTDDDSTAVIQKDVTVHTTPVDGETTISLTPTDTDIALATYKYDIQTKNTDGDIYTVVVGNFQVHRDITRRTS